MDLQVHGDVVTPNLEEYDITFEGAALVRKTVRVRARTLEAAQQTAAFAVARATTFDAVSYQAGLPSFLPGHEPSMVDAVKLAKSERAIPLPDRTDEATQSS